MDFDYDGDGRIDVRTYMRDGKPTRLEGDTNGDGLVDRWEYYDASGALTRVGGSTAGTDPSCKNVPDTILAPRAGSAGGSSPVVSACAGGWHVRCCGSPPP